MQKTIDKVMDALQDNLDIGFIGSGDDYTVSILGVKQAAKAAIEALDIVILPKDAEPQEGDLVRYTITSGVEQEIVELYSEARVVLFNNRADIEYYITIEKRNGKPVKMEE